MYYSIFLVLALIGCLCYLYFNFAKTEATSDHFKLNKKSSAPANFMHPVYLKRNLVLGVSLCLAVMQGIHGVIWQLYVAEFLACLSFYIPLHDGFYYVTRNKWKKNSYKGGFWTAVDSDPGNKFMKIMNEPTSRKLLFVWGCFCIVFIITFEPFM